MNYFNQIEKMFTTQTWVSQVAVIANHLVVMKMYSDLFTDDTFTS